MQPHSSSALYGAAALLTVARTHVMLWQCHCLGLGLISLRAAREWLTPRFRSFSTAPRKALRLP